MRMVVLSTAALVFGTVGAFAAPMATVSDVAGNVLVDSGKGFARVSALTSVPDGSRVMVTQKSKAVLAYADGCKMTLAPASITTVSSKTACKKTSRVGAADLTPDQVMAPVVAAPMVPTSAGISPFVWAAGAALAGGAIGCAIAESNKSDTLRLRSDQRVKSDRRGDRSTAGAMVPAAGLEPATFGLQTAALPTELCRQRHRFENGSRAGVKRRDTQFSRCPVSIDIGERSR